MITAHHKLRLRLRRSERSRRRTAKAAQMVLEASEVAAARKKKNKKKALEDDSICINLGLSMSWMKLWISWVLILGQLLNIF